MKCIHKDLKISEARQVYPERKKRRTLSIREGEYNFEGFRDIVAFDLIKSSARHEPIEPDENLAVTLQQEVTLLL